MSVKTEGSEDGKACGRRADQLGSLMMEDIESSTFLLFKEVGKTMKKKQPKKGICEREIEARWIKIMG